MSRGSSLGRISRVLALGVAVLVLAQVGPGAAQTTEDKIRSAERKVKQIKRELRRARAQRELIQGRIEALVRQIAQAMAQRHALQDRIDETNRAITRQNKAIRVLQGRLDERARLAYITGPGGVLDAILGSRSLSEMSDRVTFLDVLARADSDITVAIDLEREQMRSQEDILADYLTQQERVLKILARQKVQLDAEFAARVAVEDRIEDALAEARDTLKDLQAQRRRQLAAALGVGNIGPPLSADGPFYFCPVDPPRSYIDDFGFPRVGHTHQGNDIFAPSGTPIRAPFHGVAQEGSGGLGGLYVHVYGDNGDYVYNAHLTRFAGVDGQRVQPGTIIGYVGQTGNAASTPPHNHFEYHPGGGSAVSPYRYLNEVCGVGGRGY